MPENALQGLRRSPNVRAFDLDPVRELVASIPSSPQENLEAILTKQVVPYGVDIVLARDIWDANRDGKIDKKAPTGAGRTVCIIDTGLYTQHPDFEGLDILGGLSETNPDPAQWPLDAYGHATHVAGTITAMHNSTGVVGVTPGTVSLYIVKIFDDAGNFVSKMHASDLAAALIWSWNPSLTNVHIRQALSATAVDLGDPGRDNYYGYGLVQYDAWILLGGGKPGKK